MPGFSQKTTSSLESLTKLLNPVAVVSNYAKSCDLQKLTLVLFQLRKQLDFETLNKIDEAWKLAQTMSEEIDLPEDDRG